LICLLSDTLGSESSLWYDRSCAYPKSMEAPSGQSNKRGPGYYTFGNLSPA
jgi:hypothetical protein